MEIIKAGELEVSKPSIKRLAEKAVQEVKETGGETVLDTALDILMSEIQKEIRKLDPRC